VDLFCGGRAVADRGDEEVLALDSRRGRYRRLVLQDGRLVGAVLLGDLRDARALPFLEEVARSHSNGWTRKTAQRAAAGIKAP